VCVNLNINDSVIKENRGELISYIIYCSCLRLKESDALEYLEDKGFNISAATYYRIKKEIEESTRERLNLIGNEEFLSQHLERIDTLKTILNEMWINYHKESNPFKKVQILEKIEENQTYPIIMMPLDMY